MKIVYNEDLDSYYITTNSNTQYLRKDGRLHISTYDEYEEEGYWDTAHEAALDLMHWKKNQKFREHDLIGVKSHWPTTDLFAVTFYVLVAVGIMMCVYILDQL